MIRKWIGFFIGFYLTVWCTPIQANEEIKSHSEGKAKNYLNQSFHTNDSDSILAFLDLAIKSAYIEKDDDALVESLIEKGLEFERRQDGDSSQFYFQYAERESQIRELSSSISAKFHRQYGYHLGNQNQFLKSLSHLDTAAQIYLSIPDSIGFGEMLSLKGSIYDNNGNPERALGYYLRSLKIYESYEDDKLIAGVLNNIAIVYKKLEDYEAALEYYNRSIDLLINFDDEIGLATSLLNRGMLYKSLENYDRALREVRIALNTFEGQQLSYGIAVAHHNLSEIHLKMNNLDSVLSHVEQSDVIAIDFQYWTIVVGNQIVLARALREMGRPDISNKSALRAFKLAAEHGFLEKQEELAALLAENYEIQDNHKMALFYYKEHKSLKDSILNKESQEQINRLRTEYDLEQKEESIKDLETINNYQKFLAEKEHKITQFLSGAIFLALLVVALFFYLYRRQKDFAMILSDQKNLLTGLNKEKDDLIAMVAHDLRSPLNNIKGLLTLIKDAEGAEQDKMIELANESTDVLRTRINQILDVEAINVGKINLKVTEVNVSDILTKLVHHITPEAEQKQISFYANSVKNLNCLADENYLLQVLENLCTNAIKFSNPNSEIFVKVSEVNAKLRFEVQDQGQGIPKGEIKNLFTRYAKISIQPTKNEMSTGLGLPIVKKYVEAMKGKVWCESEVGVGSTFFIELPKA